ncbi:MAG TPA: hypothetical protein VFC10_05040 [Terriglobia bacterium]|jgi:hypothetical protein|nr:hypothetical protein [Terriglobia bacterium]
MKPSQGLFMRGAIRGAMGAALMLSFGCTQNRLAETDRREAAGAHRADHGKFSPTDASVCLHQMIKNPPGRLHLSFAESSSDSKSTSIEADVTPARITYTRRETSARQTSASTKKLEMAQLSEMELDFDIMGPVPWHGELVAAQDAARAEGKESVNGYDTLKYAMDTANEPASQKATFASLMAVKDYDIAGQAWITADTGCLVKYSIDFTKDARDGNVTKVHFEGDVTRK